MTGLASLMLTQGVLKLAVSPVTTQSVPRSRKEIYECVDHW